jgi:hypothetical protein
MFPLRNFVALSASWFVPHCALQAQTPATGLVTISGSLQGAIYLAVTPLVQRTTRGKSKSLLMDISLRRVTAPPPGRRHPNNWPGPSPQN